MEKEARFTVQWRGHARDGREVEGRSPNTFTEERAMYLAYSMDKLTHVPHEVVRVEE